MDISGTKILFDADNMNIEEGIEIETAYSLLSTFMDKYDYMYDMSECTNVQAYCLVANAKDIYHLIRATWNILENVKEQNKKVQELIAQRQSKFSHTGSKNRYPLSGMIQCGCCGKNYQRKV